MSEIFPSAAEYESDPQTSENRRLVLDTIGKLQDIMNAISSDDPIVQESQLAELNELGEQLESLGITMEQLNKHIEGDGRFTEQARRDPRIMLQWIGHDVHRIIQELPTAIDAIGVRRIMSEFDDPIEVDDGKTMGMLEHGQVPYKVAEFLRKQTSLAFFVDSVLDAGNYKE